MKRFSCFLLLVFLCSCANNNPPGSSSLPSSDNAGTTSHSAGTSGASSMDSSTPGNSSGMSSEDSGEYVFDSGTQDTSPEDEAFLVTFITNCDAVLDSIYASYVVSPPTLVNGDKSLEGWYLEAGFATRVLFPYHVTRNVTLHAKWVEGQQGLVFQPTIDGRGYELLGYTGNLTSVAIPSYFNAKPVLSIADGAFYDNQTLTAVVFPVLLETIGNYAFYNCSRLSIIELPATLTTIGTSSFQNAAAHTISLGQYLRYIGNSAFQNTKAESIIVPSSIEEIGAMAFKDCATLTSIRLTGANPPMIRLTTFETGIVRINVPAGSLSTYKNAEVWKDFSEIIFGY